MQNSEFDRARRNAGALETDLIDSYAAGVISRRNFLVRGSVMGLGAALMGTIIAACGGDDEEGTTGATTGGTTAPTEAGGTTPATDAAPSGEIKQGGNLRIASQKPSTALDPVSMADLGAYTMVTQCFEYLCAKGEGATLVPGLAESWSPNADGTVWTFKLRPGVTWHDGSAFTSADVVATMDRLAPGNLQAYVDVGSTKAIDDLTVEMTIKTADQQFPAQLSWSNPQAVIAPVSWAADSTLDGTPNGTGAFKLESYDGATGATFTRNDAWWGGVPYLDSVEFIFSDDIATQMNGLQGGAADAIVQFSVIGGDAILADPNLTVESIRGSAHRQLWMNTREGTFTDVKVRQAVALGLDRQALIDTALAGRGDIGNDHPIAPVYEFFDSAVPQRERDVEKAKALLEEAGKAGLEITLHAGKLQEIPQLAELIQTQLKDIGMVVTLNVEGQDTFYNRWCKVYDSTNEPAGCDGGEEFGIVDYGNRATPDVYLLKAYATGEWNSAHYVSEPFRAAVVEYQAATDLAGRKAAATKLQTIANEDVPYVIPYFYNSLMAYSNTVSGIVATGLGHYELGKAGFVA
jgi:peptide/nickel transport system substrate-binding protein